MAEALGSTFSEAAHRRRVGVDGPEFIDSRPAAGVGAGVRQEVGVYRRRDVERFAVEYLALRNHKLRVLA